MAGSGRGLIGILFLQLAGGTAENHEECHSR
jgi:hypothetical protein